MIESKFTFLEVEVEGSFIDHSERTKPNFRLPPEAFEPAHMRSPAYKLILPMIDVEMAPLPNTDQPIEPSPHFRIDGAVQANLPSNNRLQHGVSTVRDEFRVDLSISLENTKDDGFSIRPSASFSFDASCPKVEIIDFPLSAKRRLRFTEFHNRLSNNSHLPIHRLAIQPCRDGH